MSDLKLYATNVGHLVTGDLEFTLRSHDDLERAKPLIVQSYELC